MLLISTRSASPLTLEFWKWVARRVIRKYTGPNAVEDSLLRGLKELKMPFKRNARAEKGDIAVVLSGTAALQEALALKEAGVLAKLIVGPNVLPHPRSARDLEGEDAVDAILMPSEWVRDTVINEAPGVADKIIVWPSGVATAPASTRTGTPVIYDKLNDGALLARVLRATGEARVFTYGGFSREEYLTALADAPYLVYLSRWESQGLALQEAWAHDVPTLVNKSTHWEVGETSWDAPQINCPYLTPEMGMIFDSSDELPTMIERVAQLHPKPYCDARLSDSVSAQNLIDIISAKTV